MPQAQPQSDADLGRCARLLLQRGLAVKDITRELGVSRATVYRWLQADRMLDTARMERRIPQLQPWFGLYPYLDQCPHVGPIRPGDTRICMRCHQSGYDLHPGMRITPKDAPAKCDHKFKPKGAA